MVSIVNRTAREEPVSLTLDTGGFDVADATGTLLSGDSMADRNTLEEPERVSPQSSPLAFEDGEAGIDVEPFSLVRVTASLEQS